MSTTDCQRCSKLTETITALRVQLREVVALSELQKADLDRLREAQAQPQANRAERAPSDALQLGLGRILLEETAAQAAEPSAVTEERAQAVAELEKVIDLKKTESGETKQKRKARPHGRRNLEFSTLPCETVMIQPTEVLEGDPDEFELVGEDLGFRLAYRPGSYVRVLLRQQKYKRKAPSGTRPEFVRGPLPESIWPSVMGDPSAIARIVVGKYADCLPLHRQETISAREGLVLPRSTQCDWLKAAHAITSRIVDAMLDDAKRRAFCIATDATGAPVRAKGQNALCHMFVLLADQDHVIFRHAAEHTSASVKAILKGYRGYLLADAASVFDGLYLNGEVVEVGCWFHLRRYFWRAIATDPERAYEALALIGRLFEIERACRLLPLAERTSQRAAQAKPILALLDAWVARYRDKVDPRGPLDAAMGYYLNQRSALRQFLKDGRLRLDNNRSEQALRHLVVGRANWTFFANEAGLSWYASFRSLIASSTLHGLNAQTYLEEILRLGPHWPVNRVLELAPRYWASTRAGLGDRHRAILRPPWEIARPPGRDAAVLAA